MDKVISVYGLSKDQAQQLAVVRPDQYRVVVIDCVTDLIATSSMLTIVNAERLDQANRNVLLGYYLDVETKCETVVWIGERMPPDKFFSYDSFCDMMTDIECVLEEASANYELSDLFHTEYSFLPARAITDSLENEMRSSFYKKYGSTPDPEITARLRNEWTALLEVDCVPELAAVYELCRWLKHNKHPFRVTGLALSGFIPYLLGVTDINPLEAHYHCPQCHHYQGGYSGWSPFDLKKRNCPDCGLEMERDGHDLIWQEFCSYGRIPSYNIYLPDDLQQMITDWAANHWIKTQKTGEWEIEQFEDQSIGVGNILFCFGLHRSEIATDYHSHVITADDKQQLIQEVQHKDSLKKVGLPAGADFSRYISLLCVEAQTCNVKNLAYLLLRSCFFSDAFPCCREDVFHYLKSHDFVDKDAFRGMTSVRKGKGLPVITDEMRAADDYWVAEYCNQIERMPSRAEIISELFFNLKSRIEVE